MINSKELLKALNDPDIPAKYNAQQFQKKCSRSVPGGLLGGLTACAGQTTGPVVGLHEVIGHGFLGWGLTHRDGANGVGYQADSWENLKALGNAHSFKEGLVDFWRWISGYDSNHDGNAGFMCPPRNDNPNDIGQAMGADGRSAWLSIAGSLPGLALDTLSSVGGMFVRKKSPLIGSAMVGFGLTDHICSSGYPISAGLMSNQELLDISKTGHDFATFAVKMSHITNLSPHTIAATTAGIWTSVVPIAALLAYLHTRSHATDVVPTTLALKRLLQKANTDPTIAQELAKIIDASPHKDNIPDLIETLLEKIPAKTLEAAKKEILSEWEKNLPKDRLQTTLTITSLAGSAMAITAKVLTALAPACGASVQAVATALTYASPIFIATSVLSTAYDLYKDLHSTVPKAAKMISLARLIISLASSALLITALFLPGFHLLLTGAIFLAFAINTTLAFARMRVIQKQFELHQALEPDNLNIMNQLWLNHQQKPAGTPMSTPLKSWVNCLSTHKLLPKAAPAA